MGGILISSTLPPSLTRSHSPLSPSFPLLGAGTQTIGGYNVLTVEGVLFGIMTFGIVLTLRVVFELWKPRGGAYNVDGVLSVMVKGLEEELAIRMEQAASNKKFLQMMSRGREINPDRPEVRGGGEEMFLGEYGGEREE